MNGTSAFGKEDGWQTLWVTDMPLFHCGSGSSIYIGTAVALGQGRLHTRLSLRKAKEAAGHTSVRRPSSSRRLLKEAGSEVRKINS